MVIVRRACVFHLFWFLGVEDKDEDDEDDIDIPEEKPFQIISIPILRMYLQEQFLPFRGTLPFAYEFER